ncbi:metallophosphoesterase family protein [Candidatus Mycalebacterium sp.]
MHPLILLTALVPLVFSSCAGTPFPHEIFDRKDVFKVWALADTQPTHPSHRRAFENAVEDLNRNTRGVHMAFVAGDIVNSASEEVFDWYLATRSKSYIVPWHEIAGNHDVKPDGGALFRKKIGKFNKTVLRGNILFIFISDEDGTKPTVISNKVFEWWKKTVENNRDKIVVVMTHAPLEGSSIVFSGLRDRQIAGSERFTEVLKKEKVDLWLSGHLHVPHFFPRTVKKKENLNGVVFVHISSIRPEVGGLKHPESRFLAFYCGTDKVSVFSRNHKKRKWQNRHAKHFTLSKTIECP